MTKRSAILIRWTVILLAVNLAFVQIVYTPHPLLCAFPVAIILLQIVALAG